MTFIPVGPLGDADERFGVAPEALDSLPDTSVLEEFEQMLYGDDGCDNFGYLIYTQRNTRKCTRKHSK